MKLPKIINTYCKYCKKTTPHKISVAKTGHKRGSLKWGSIQRAKKRGRGVGFGNKGRWGSKPTRPKRSGAKSSKKFNIKLTCDICHKSTARVAGRVKKVEIQ